MRRSALAEYASCQPGPDDGSKPIITLDFVCERVSLTLLRDASQATAALQGAPGDTPSGRVMVAAAALAYGCFEGAHVSFVLRPSTFAASATVASLVVVCDPGSSTPITIVQMMPPPHVAPAAAHPESSGDFAASQHAPSASVPEVEVDLQRVPEDSGDDEADELAQIAQRVARRAAVRRLRARSEEMGARAGSDVPLQMSAGAGACPASESTGAKDLSLEGGSAREVSLLWLEIRGLGPQTDEAAHELEVSLTLQPIRVLLVAKQLLQLQAWLNTGLAGFREQAAAAAEEAMAVASQAMQEAASSIAHEPPPIALQVWLLAPLLVLPSPTHDGAAVVLRSGDLQLSNSLARTETGALAARLELTLSHTQLLIACRGDALDVDWMLRQDYQPHWFLPTSHVELTVDRSVHSLGEVPAPSSLPRGTPGPAGPSPSRLGLKLRVSPVALEISYREMEFVSTLLCELLPLLAPVELPCDVPVHDRAASDLSTLGTLPRPDAMPSAGGMRAESIPRADSAHTRRPRAAQIALRLACGIELEGVSLRVLDDSRNNTLPLYEVSLRPLKSGVTLLLGAAGNHIAIPWQSHGSHMAIPWQSHSNHIAITQQSHGYHMAITWLSHGNHVALLLGAEDAIGKEDALYECLANLEAQLSVWHFNPSNGVWEPLVEPWGVTMEAEMGAAAQLKLAIGAQEMLQLNVTHAQVRTLLETIELFGTLADPWLALGATAPRQRQNQGRADSIVVAATGESAHCVCPRTCALHNQTEMVLHVTLPRSEMAIDVAPGATGYM